MKKVDIIGIGAINFDYIFSSKRTDVINQKKSNMDDGDESFVKEHVFKATPHNQLHRTPKSGKIKT